MKKGGHWGEARGLFSGRDGLPAGHGLVLAEKAATLLGKRFPS